MPAMVPARLGYTADGTPFSETFGDVYHAAAGGLGQARHVFLGGCDLPARWRGRERFVVVETGFGLGLNFLATWQAWHDDPARGARLHFVSAEKHPLGRADLARALGAHEALAPFARQLVERWPPCVSGYHRIEFDHGRVVLTLLFGAALDGFAQLEAHADAIYLDGHAPERNPDMWNAPLFAELARLAAPGAMLATWCVAGRVRAALREEGFVLEKRPGFAHKREMLVGHMPGASAIEAARERRALILGAGLAGTACAARLARRGWQVTLIERQAAPAMATSGNLAGVVKPVIAARENRASRIVRAGFLHAARQWSGEPFWNARGVLQIARDAAQEQRFSAALRELGLPEDFARPVDRDAASHLAGYAASAGGVWLPGAGVAAAPAVCAARLVGATHPSSDSPLEGGRENPASRVRHDACASRQEESRSAILPPLQGGSRGGDGFPRPPHLLYRTEVAALTREHDLWVARDAHGTVIAEAPIAILANGTDAIRFAALPLQSARGQLSYLPHGALPKLAVAVCREGCVYPAPDGRICLGASYDDHDDPALREDSHRENLARLERMLPAAAAGIEPAALDGRVGFRAVTPDRLPIAGALGTPGLYGLLGLGSRGLVWSDLGAELLACQLEGEPWPMEWELADALSPGRFPGAGE